MGALFKRDEYPTSSSIRGRFAFNYDFVPVPNTKDFRVAIPKDAASDLRARLEGAMNRRMDNAMGDIRKQLKEHLQRMSERLVTVTNAKGEPSQVRFHDTLVTGAYELCDLISDFSIGGDHELQAVRQRLSAALTGASAEDLRVNHDLRADVKQEVDAILNSCKW